MKIALVLGRGVEGVGVTKNVVEFQKLFPSAEIFASIDKEWDRRNSMEFDVNYYRGTDWDTVSKQSKKYPDLMTCTDVIDSINQMDMCIIFSLPSKPAGASKSHSEEYANNFLKMLDEIKVRKSLVNVDHNAASLHRNANLVEVCNKLDVLLCHDINNPFGEWVRKNNIETPLTNMGVGFNFNKDAWRPIEEQDPWTVRWVGRTAMWKGPTIMIDIHNEHLRNKNYVTILEGLEGSIQYPMVLYHGWNPTTKIKSDRRDVINYFRPERDIDETYGIRIPPYGQEQKNMGAYLYPGYKHTDMIERMSKSAFGSDLMNFKKNMYGNNIEYCHSDSFAAGVVPLFHKHFCDNIVHKKQGKPVSQCDNTGTLGIDLKNADEVSNKMVKLSNDNVMRDEYRNMAYDFWKEHCDAIDVYQDIIDKTMTMEKEPSLEDLFA